MVKKVHYLGMFLLLALMATKISALHIYSHQDYDDGTVEECSLCDFAIENQNAELLSDYFLEVGINQTFFQKDLPLIENSVVLVTTENNLYRFSRPPPIS